MYFILLNIFRLNTSSSVVPIKSAVSIQKIRGFIQCYSIVKITFKNFNLTIFMSTNTNIIDETN